MLILSMIYQGFIIYKNMDDEKVDQAETAPADEIEKDIGLRIDQGNNNNDLDQSSLDVQSIDIRADKDGNLEKFDIGHVDDNGGGVNMHVKYCIG